eukprot:TRINITY_DN4367_c0_g3_i3.p1 TRINITY_DN4367_c0_g3~~TRINITY_DN4367_c0_g3_i3.p1  ORF type:complete len:158 (-),score=26.60 TRINITY_DN4367_c0_g3_i3:103-513(-)
MCIRDRSTWGKQLFEINTGKSNVQLILALKIKGYLPYKESRFKPVVVAPVHIEPRSSENLVNENQHEHHESNGDFINRDALDLTFKVESERGHKEPRHDIQKFYLIHIYTQNFATTNGRAEFTFAQTADFIFARKG